MKKQRYILPPEATDGVHPTVVDSLHEVNKAFALWSREATPGEEWTVKLALMTDAECEALQTI